MTDHQPSLLDIIDKAKRATLGEASSPHTLNGEKAPDVAARLYREAMDPGEREEVPEIDADRLRLATVVSVQLGVAMDAARALAESIATVPSALYGSEQDSADRRDCARDLMTKAALCKKAAVELRIARGHLFASYAKTSMVIGLGGQIGACRRFESTVSAVHRYASALADEAMELADVLPYDDRAGHVRAVET